MVGHIRIRGKAEQLPPSEAKGYPRINGVVTTWQDLSFFVVAPDGSETPLTGVKAFRIFSHEGTEPLTACLVCYVDELDVVAEVEPGTSRMGGGT